MIRRIVLATLTLTVLVAAVAGWRLSHYAVWMPLDYQNYEIESGYEVANRPQARWVAEAVSAHVYDQALFPVKGALLMAITLDAYATLYEQHDKFVAYFGAAKVASAFSPSISSRFTQESDAFVEQLFRQAGATDTVAQLVEEAESLAAITVDVPEIPKGEGVWYSEEGSFDRDAGAGIYPLHTATDVPLPPPAPVSGTPEDDLDLTAVALATSLVNREQATVSVYWQGSMAFEKTSLTQGYTPSDVWQLIALMHAGQTMEEGEFVQLIADLANVVRDASILTWRVKYRDWSQRPSMRQANLYMSIGNPPFPGYVSGHATIASAAATFLAARDPQHADLYRKIAQDAAHSRFFGGVHPPSDNVIGAQLGQKVAHKHLGLDVDPDYEPVGILWLDRPILSLALGAVTTYRDISQLIATAAADRPPTFTRLSASEHDLPTPTRKEDPVTLGFEAFYGSIAARDLNDDGLVDVMITGDQELRIYRNLGDFQFELQFVANHQNLTAAYFTHDHQGRVDGLVSVGHSAPQFYRRESDFQFTEPRKSDELEALTWYSHAVVLYDHDADGDEDILILNHWNGLDSILVSQTRMHDSEEVADNYLLLRNGDDYVFSGTIGATAATFAGGLIDLDGDAKPDKVLVNDGAPIEVLSGATGQPMPTEGLVKQEVAGMSFTPVRVGRDQRLAIHVSNIFTSPDEAFYVPNTERAAYDILVAWDEDRGAIVDLADGALQSGRREWSWGSAAGDLNADGLDDLIIGHGYVSFGPYGCGYRVLLQTEDGNFQHVTPRTGLASESFCPRSLLLTDLDGDDDLDMMVNNGFEAAVWENTSQYSPKNFAPPWAGDLLGFMTQPPLR